MMSVPEAYKLIEHLPIGTWVAISTDEKTILASSTDVGVVYEKVKGWDNAHPPMFLRVHDPRQTWIL